MFSWYDPIENIVLPSSISKSISQSPHKSSWLSLESGVSGGVDVLCVSVLGWTPFFLMLLIATAYLSSKFKQFVLHLVHSVVYTTKLKIEF